MNLNNFESYVSSAILQRGKQYFKNGSIEENFDNSMGYFTAIVKGSMNYSVEVELDEQNSITHCYCDCPYDWGGLCKHIIAVLFDIRQIQKGVIINVEEVSQVGKLKIMDVLNTLDEKALRKALIEAIAESPKLKIKLIAEYRKEKGLLTKPELARNIDALFKKYKFDYYGYISTLDIKLLKEELVSLHQKAIEYISTENFAPALDILETLLEKVVYRFNNINDKSDKLEGIILEVLETLFSINDKSLQERTFSYIIDSKLLFKYELFYEKIAPFMISVVKNNRQELSFYRWLQEFRLYESKVGKQRYFTTQESVYKFLLLEKLYGLPRALVHANRLKHEIDEMLLKIIENDINNKNYVDGLYNVFLGEVRTNGLLKTTFFNLKSRLFVLLKKQPDLIAQASKKALFVIRKPICYDILKENTATEKWDEVLEEIIETLKKSKFGVQGLMNHIYIQEEMYYKLFDVVEESSNPKTALLTYDKYLIKSDIEHTGILYTVVINDILEAEKNRETYIEVAGLLKRMKMLQLGEAIQLILLDFKENHKRRRALWEELKNVGIELNE